MKCETELRHSRIFRKQITQNIKQLLLTCLACPGLSMLQDASNVLRLLLSTQLSSPCTSSWKGSATEATIGGLNENPRKLRRLGCQYFTYRKTHIHKHLLFT